MSTAAEDLLQHTRELVASARTLPVDEAAMVIEQSVSMLQAAQAELLVEAERAGELKDSGCATVRSFAATTLRRSPEDAAQVARVALHLAHLPGLAQAYRDGRAHTANVRAVVAHVTSCGLDVLQSHEDSLVDLATRATPREIHHFCRELATMHRPERERDRVAAQGGRLVRIRRVGELAHVDAMLDPVVADRLKTWLSKVTEAARRHERSENASPRPYAERCADALERIVTLGMDALCDSESGVGGRNRVHATVTVQLETLLGLSDHGRAVLSRFGVIPPATAARLSCDAVVRLVVEHGDRVLDVGRSARVVTRRQHAALAATYETCVMPGCAVRFADCDIHHLWWWSLGGPTDLDLQIPLCGSHHRWLHEGGCSITREDGRLVFRDPRGRVLVKVAEVLERQLSLVRAQRNGPVSDDARMAVDAMVSRARGGRETAYGHGRWGWTGYAPSAPPGHAPPVPA